MCAFFKSLMFNLNLKVPVRITEDSSDKAHPFLQRSLSQVIFFSSLLNRLGFLCMNVSFMQLSFVFAPICQPSNDPPPFCPPTVSSTTSRSECPSTQVKSVQGVLMPISQLTRSFNVIRGPSAHWLLPPTTLSICSFSSYLKGSYSTVLCL